MAHMALSQIIAFMDVDAQNSVNNFISSGKREIGKKERGGIVRPIDAKLTIKKVWLSGDIIRKDMRKFYKDVNNGKNFKGASQHKIRTAHMQVVNFSSKFIAEITKVHNILSLMIRQYTTPSKTGEITFQDIKDHSESFSQILKHPNIPNIFDTDELDTLKTFNLLRNSLIHSSMYSTFWEIDKEYIEKIYILLEDTDAIFMWLYYKTKEQYQGAKD